MVIDFQSTGFVDGVIVTPEFVYQDKAKQPSQVVETILVGGSSTGGAVALTGTADQSES